MTMIGILINLKPGPTSTSYHEKLSWEIKEEDWNSIVQKGRSMILQLKDDDPGTEKIAQYLPNEQDGPYPGGHIELDDGQIFFLTV